jgi:tetratricopeptide (TPR) repeat protein
MPNPLNSLKESFQFFIEADAKTKTLICSIITFAVCILCIIGATIYYYVRTPEDTVIVDTAGFPAGVPQVFTPDNLTDHVAAQLQKMIALANLTDDVDEPDRAAGPGPRSIKEKTFPVSSLSNDPSPAFDLKWREISLNWCRRQGMHWKAKRFLELGVIGLPDKGWRLTALLKRGADLESSSGAPRAGGACGNFETCVEDLAMQTLQLLDPKRLLRYCIKINTPESNRLVVELYKKFPTASLKADDFVAWGNAYYELGRWDEALQQYQEALKKNENSCAARVARGFVYFKRAHGTQLLADLKYAEKDFRDGVSCDPNNEFTVNALGHTLLREWNNTPKPKRDRSLLVEAKENCEKALKINPEFEVAAVNIGYILYRQEKREEALSQLESLSQKYPTDSNLFLNYGFLLYLEYLSDHTQDRLKQAIAQTHKSWELNPDGGAALNNLGFFYYEANNYLQAVEFWKKAKDVSTDDPDCIAGLALGFFQTGDKVSAITLLTQAIQIDAGFRDPKYVKEKHYWSDRAASDLMKLLALLPASKQPTKTDENRSGLSGRTL